MNKSSLSLEAGEEEEIEVAVARNTEETGAYTVKINAESQYDYETFAEFEVDLADCYSMEIARVEGYASVCSVDNPEYVFEITNTGSKVLDLDLGISGVDAELDVSEISLEAGETGTIRATLDVSKITSEIEEKTFTITAESEFEEASEELTIEVQKCYDVVISMPELKICRGITNTAEILIRNYGTKDQIVDLTVTPEWAVLENSITLASGESKKIKLIMDVPIDTIEENVELEAVYSGITLSESTKLNYGSQSYCFGIELGVKQKELEAAKCIGKTQEFELSNLGVTEQEIKLTSNVDWVYFEKELITLEEGQSETGYFVMIPPIDIAKGVYEIKIIAKSEYETIAFDEIKLNVFGQEFGEQPIDVDVHDLNVTKLIENISVDVEFRFYLLNDSNRTAKVYAITSPDFESVFVPEAETVKKMETISVKAYLDLPENYDQNFVIMSIDVNTDEGVIRKTLRFKLEEGTGEDSDEGNEEIDAGVVTLGSGLLTLENMANLGLIVLIAVVAALIVYAIVAKPKPKKKAKKKKKTKK